jgi:gentisate 1,2-dioxygenase
MAAFMQLMPWGFEGANYCCIDSAVYSVVEGGGRVEAGDWSFVFGPRDVFIIPSWQPHQFSAKSDCLLFSFSDRAAQEAFGFWQ